MTGAVKMQNKLTRETTEVCKMQWFYSEVKDASATMSVIQTFSF
jgi:hypothetical protein